MDADHSTQKAARAAAEEILRIIYGDDLSGCTVSLDRITAVISTAMTGQAQVDRAISELNDKAYEAIRLLSTPPANGESLNPEELRSLLGVAVGIGAGIALSRYLGTLFFGVSPGNPATYLEVALLMIAIALVACLLPALRAVRLNPMVALRYE